MRLVLTGFMTAQNGTNYSLKLEGMCPCTHVGSMKNPLLIAEAEDDGVHACMRNLLNYCFILVLYNIVYMMLWTHVCLGILS